MFRPLTALAATLLLFAPVATARAAEPVWLAQNDKVAEKVFSDLERRLIRDVLGAAGVDTDVRRSANGGKDARSGPANRGRLPPGLQMQLERNGRLPPGIEKRPFPTHLRTQLPAPLPGTERLIVGNDAVLVDTATTIILDIIHDVVRPR